MLSDLANRILQLGGLAWNSRALIVDLNDGPGANVRSSPALSESPTALGGPLAVAEDLRRLSLGLAGLYLSEDGTEVDYEAMRGSPAFEDLQLLAATQLPALGEAQLASLPRSSRIAFWVNLYNVMVLVGTCAIPKPSTGGPALAAWFTRVRYRVAGRSFSLDDIEHGILRGNRPSPSSWGALLGLPGLSPPPFCLGDPRLAHCIADPDPRIHFALNCGARSCPRLRIYSADRLEEDLREAARSFVAADVEVDLASKSVRCSRLFQWYEADFGGRTGLLSFLADHLPPENDLIKMLKADDFHVDHISLSYESYNWDVNFRRRQL